jgi:nucleotide-binding universal stress UspA family protein
MPNGFQTIVHPTDFSDASASAFAHALRIVLAIRGTLYLVHVANSESSHDGFPHIRHALALWNLMDKDEPPAAVGKLGIKVSKIGLESETPRSGLLNFLGRHPSDLIVIATHGRDGIDHWLHGSIAEEVSRQAKATTLFIPPTARGFVDQNTGKISLSRVLVPVDNSPPTDVLCDIRAFVQSVGGSDAVVEFMHVGETGPQIIEDGTLVPVALQSGDPVSVILATAKQVDLVAMPTKGHDGLLDVLRGSTTERVVRHAPCPVLAVPSRNASPRHVPSGQETKGNRQHFQIMTSTAEEKAFLRVAVAAIPRVAEIIWRFPPDDRAGALEWAEQRFLTAALDHGCTELTAQSRVSAVMRRLRGRLERLQAGEKKLQALLHKLTEPD